MPLTRGDRLGSYEILGPLGAGGMGEVYRARDARLGREVAIKILPAELNADPSRRRRFEVEARAVAALNHPNICTIYGVEEAAGQNLIAMELVDGETLAARLAKGPMPPEKALPVAMQLAAAIDAAHRQGIVHRDLKPANIMLAKSGVKVLDFGLAKVDRDLDEQDETLTGVTQAGAVLGTWQYMSPEQVQGKPLDPRTDLFSFGCVLFEMLTGAHAFEGGTPAHLAASILTAEPTAAAALPPPLKSVVRHCLEKDPDDRFQSARDLLFALESLRLEAPASDPAIQRAPSRRLLWPAAAVAAVAFAALGGWWFGYHRRSAPAARYDRLTFRRGYVQNARFAPDGRAVIYAATVEGQPIELFTMTPGIPESSRPLGFRSTGLLSISPAGEMAVSTQCSVNFWGDCTGTLAQMPLANGAPRDVLEDVVWADWARDGKRLAVTIADKGFGSRLEFPVGNVVFRASGAGWAGDPRVSPAGDLVAFADHYYFGDDGAVAVVDVQGRKKTLTQTFNSLRGLAWAPGGDEIWFTAVPLGAARALYAVTLSGALRLVAQLPASLRLQDIGRDGKVLFITLDESCHVFYVGPGQSAARDLTWLDWAASPVLSPDGKRILISESGAGTGGKLALYLRPTDGSPAVRLGDDVWPHGISPDGKWVLGMLRTPSRTGLILVPLGSGKPLPIDIGNLQLGSSFDGSQNATWFPDGRRILYSATEPGHQARAYVQDVAGGPPRAATPEGISGSLVTPDGAALFARDSESKAWLYPLSGGAPKPLPALTATDVPLAFSTDGRFLYLTRDGPPPVKIRRLDLASGRIDPWRETPAMDPAGLLSLHYFYITPDGQSFAYQGMRTLSELYVAEGLK